MSKGERRAGTQVPGAMLQLSPSNRTSCAVWPSITVLNTMALKSPDREAVRRSKDSANRVLSMVKALLNHALRDPANGITDDHAWRLVKPYQGVATPRATHFSEAQARALIETTPDKEFADLLTAGFLTGARYGELIACSSATLMMSPGP